MPERYKRNPNTKCFVCGKEIYRRPVELKRSNRRAFCSNTCNGIANRKEKPCVVCGKPIQASLHKITCSRSCSNTYRAGIKYKIGRPKDNAYTQLALKNKLLRLRENCCERCGYNRKEILQVHHKNWNHKENTMENLALLCPNCHCEEHYLFGKK